MKKVIEISSKMKRDPKILLKASLLGFFALGLLTPIYAIFVQNIGGDILDAGIAYALFSISMESLLLRVSSESLILEMTPVIPVP